MIAVTCGAAPALLAVSTAAFAGHHEEGKMAGDYGDKPMSVVAVGLASEGHNTLITAVTAKVWMAKNGVVHVIDIVLMP